MKNIFILILLVFIASPASFAQVKINRSENISVLDGRKYYIHTVEAGQTMYSICKAYNIYQKEIIKANNLSGNNLRVGQKLKIPIINKTQKNTKDFLYHKIKKDETIAKISEKYKISISDIYLHNPSAKYGIKLGEVLKIPNVKKGNFDYQDDNFFFHTVTSGQTLFSISQRYGITIKQLKMFNPKVVNGLRVSQTLRIPKTNYDITERLPVVRNYETFSSFLNIDFDPQYFIDPNVTPCNKYVYNKSTTFKIALLLPLYTSRNLSLARKYSREKDRLFYKNSRNFIEMYEGILVAIQDLKKQGISIDLKVYDTENSPAKVREIVKQMNFSELDLILGPVYSNNVKIVGRYAQKYRVNLVSPLSQNKITIKNNPFVFQVKPSSEMRIKKASNLLSRLYDTSMVFIHNGTPQEQENIDTYKKKLVKSFAVNQDVNEVVIKNINYNFGEIEAVEDAMSIGMLNVIIIPSNDEVFVSKVIDKLGKLSETYDIKVLGDPSWERFQNINFEHLTKLSFHYISSDFTDYSYWKTKQFIKKYRDYYQTDPSKYAFGAYDFTYFFVTALKQYGKNFQFCLSPSDKIPNSKGIIYNFDFVRHDKFSGFENNGVFILSYDKNFRLQEAKLD